MLGSSFVIAGVALIVIFAPNQSCPLTAGRFSYLLAQPGAILLLVFITLMLIALCAHVVPRYAERHVLIPISCASLLGSLKCSGSPWRCVAAKLRIVSKLSRGGVDANISFSPCFLISLATNLLL